jgi:ribosomal protein L32
VGRSESPYQRRLSQEDGFCPECGEEFEPARLCTYCGDYHPLSVMSCDVEDMCGECFRDGMKRLSALASASEDTCALAVLDFLSTY